MVEISFNFSIPLKQTCSADDQKCKEVFKPDDEMTKTSIRCGICNGSTELNVFASKVECDQAICNAEVKNGVAKDEEQENTADQRRILSENGLAIGCRRVENYESNDEDDYEDEEYEDEEKEENNNEKKLSSSSGSPPVEVTLVDGKLADQEVEISEVISLRYNLPKQLNGLQWMAECEVEPVKEYGSVYADGQPCTSSLKHDLVTLCTIGTGAFGRVELTRHRKTGKYFALKSMYIPSVIDKRQVEHVHQEKRILESLNHPFIVKMYDTAKDNSYLYMVMEFLSGGEIFSYLRISKGFPSSVTKFYAAEILLALEYLHLKYIAYRDLKTENLMLTHTGHIKLTDFGFAKVIHNKSYTLCGTPTYLAPEIYSRRGHNLSVDFWALGILIFELMAGYPPFRGKSAEEVQNLIQEQQEPIFPRKTFSSNAKDIISKLLILEPKERLGGQSSTDVRRHAWFDAYDWDELYNWNYKPPLVPILHHEGDTGNFDSYQEIDQFSPAFQRDLDMFSDW